MGLRVEGRHGGERVRIDYDDEGRPEVVSLRLGQVVDEKLIRALTRLAAERDSCAPKPLTYTEAAEQLGVSTKWLQRRVRAGTIPHTIVGRRVRFRPGDIRSLLEARARGGEALPTPSRRLP